MLFVASLDSGVGLGEGWRGGLDLEDGLKGVGVESLMGFSVGFEEPSLVWKWNDNLAGWWE